jgi:hypothetical protein
MVQTNLAFEFLYHDVISMPLVYLLSIVSFHVHFGVSCNIVETLVEFVSINPYPSVDAHFPFILCMS